MTGGEKAFQVLLVVLISLMCLAMVYPFIHMLAISFSTPAAAAHAGFHLYPRQFSFDSYETAFHTKGLLSGFGNSLFRTVVGTAASLLVMLLAAYPLSKKTLPHRGFFTMFIVLTMFFSGGLIPTFMLILDLGLYNSRWIYILGPGFLISTFSLLILRNFLTAIPAELEDSAKIDGANDFRLLMSIIAPLCKPVLATLALWSAVNHWNSWFDALVYIKDSAKIVLQIYLRRLIIEDSFMAMQEITTRQLEERQLNPQTVKAAVLMIVTFPILLVYPFIQRHFVKGIMVGSIKG